MLQCFQVLHFMVFVEKILCIRVLECELIRLRDVLYEVLARLSVFHLENMLCYDLFHTLVNQF